MFFGFSWAWLALAGRNAIPWLFTTFRDFEPSEHVPRTLARAHTYTQCSPGPPACPVTERKRKDPRAQEQRMPISKKSSIIYIAHAPDLDPAREGTIRTAPAGALRQTDASCPHGRCACAWPVKTLLYGSGAWCGLSVMERCPTHRKINDPTHPTRYWRPSPAMYRPPHVLRQGS